MRWTEGRLNGFITSLLRGGFRKYPPKYNTLKAARIGRKVNPKTGRQAIHFKCNSCGGEFLNSDVQVDHINPVVDPEKGFKTWDEFIDRLFCEEDNLQVLCLDCHKKKSKIERTIRASVKRKER